MSAAKGGSECGCKCVDTTMILSVEMNMNDEFVIERG